MSASDFAAVREARDVIRDVLMDAGDYARSEEGLAALHCLDAALARVEAENKQLRELLAEAGTMYERGRFGAHDREWARWWYDRLRAALSGQTERCEKCGEEKNAPTEQVDNRGPGWKCESCRWWNWLPAGAALSGEAP